MKLKYRHLDVNYSRVKIIINNEFKVTFIKTCGEKTRIKCGRAYTPNLSFSM